MTLKNLLKTVCETHYEVVDASDNFMTYEIDYLAKDEDLWEYKGCHKLDSTANCLEKILGKKVRHISVNTAKNVLTITVE